MESSEFGAQSVSPSKSFKDAFYLDTETVPGGKKVPLEEIKADGRIKDEKKIEANKKEKQEELYRKQGLDPFKAQIISMAFALNDGDVSVEFSEKDESLLIKFLEEFLCDNFMAPDGSFSDYLWVGQNIRAFDLHLIWLRALKYGHYHLAKMIPRNRYDKSVVDLVEVVKGPDLYGKGYGQSNIGEFFGIGGKDFMTGDQVYDFYIAGKFKEIMLYNKDDVEKVRKIFKIVRNGGWF